MFVDGCPAVFHSKPDVTNVAPSGRATASSAAPPSLVSTLVCVVAHPQRGCPLLLVCSSRSVSWWTAGHHVAPILQHWTLPELDKGDDALTAAVWKPDGRSIAFTTLNRRVAIVDVDLLGDVPTGVLYVPEASVLRVATSRGRAAMRCSVLVPHGVAQRIIATQSVIVLLTSSGSIVTLDWRNGSVLQHVTTSQLLRSLPSGAYGGGGAIACLSVNEYPLGVATALSLADGAIFLFQNRDIQEGGGRGGGDSRLVPAAAALDDLQPTPAEANVLFAGGGASSAAPHVSSAEGSPFSLKVGGAPLEYVASCGPQRGWTHLEVNGARGLVAVVAHDFSTLRFFRAATTSEQQHAPAHPSSSSSSSAASMAQRRSPIVVNGGGGSGSGLDQSFGSSSRFLAATPAASSHVVALVALAAPCVSDWCSNRTALQSPVAAMKWSAGSGNGNGSTGVLLVAVATSGIAAFSPGGSVLFTTFSRLTSEMSTPSIMRRGSQLPTSEVGGAAASVATAASPFHVADVCASLDGQRLFVLRTSGQLDVFASSTLASSMDSSVTLLLSPTKLIVCDTASAEAADTARGINDGAGAITSSLMASALGSEMMCVADPYGSRLGSGDVAGVRSREALSVPTAYVKSNHPIRFAAASPDASALVVAGKHGAAVCNRKLRRWRLFGSERQEKSFRVVATPVWLGNELLALPVRFAHDAPSRPPLQFATPSSETFSDTDFAILVFGRLNLDLTATVAAWAMPSRPLHLCALPHPRDAGRMLLVAVLRRPATSAAAAASTRSSSSTSVTSGGGGSGTTSTALYELCAQVIECEMVFGSSNEDGTNDATSSSLMGRKYGINTLSFPGPWSLSAQELRPLASEGAIESIACVAFPGATQPTAPIDRLNGVASGGIAAKRVDLSRRFDLSTVSDATTRGGHTGSATTVSTTGGIAAAQFALFLLTCDGRLLAVPMNPVLSPALSVEGPSGAPLFRQSPSIPNAVVLCHTDGCWRLRDRYLGSAAFAVVLPNTKGTHLLSVRLQPRDATAGGGGGFIAGSRSKLLFDFDCESCPVGVSADDAAVLIASSTTSSSFFRPCPTDPPRDRGADPSASMVRTAAPPQPKLTMTTIVRAHVVDHALILLSLDAATAQPASTLTPIARRYRVARNPYMYAISTNPTSLETFVTESEMEELRARGGLVDAFDRVLHAVIHDDLGGGGEGGGLHTPMGESLAAAATTTTLPPETARLRRERQVKLQRLVQTLRRYDEYYEAVVLCVRKCDAGRWRSIFDVVGPPQDFMTECVATGHVAPAAHMVRVLLMDPDDAESVWTLEEGLAIARGIFKHLIARGQATLGHELLRFIARLSYEVEGRPAGKKGGSGVVGRREADTSSTSPPGKRGLWQSVFAASDASGKTVPGSSSTATSKVAPSAAFVLRPLLNNGGVTSLTQQPISRVAFATAATVSTAALSRPPTTPDRSSGMAASAMARLIAEHPDVAKALVDRATRLWTSGRLLLLIHLFLLFELDLPHFFSHVSSLCDEPAVHLSSVSVAKSGWQRWFKKVRRELNTEDFGSKREDHGAGKQQRLSNLHPTARTLAKVCVDALCLARQWACAAAVCAACGASVWLSDVLAQEKEAAALGASADRTATHLATGQPFSAALVLSWVGGAHACNDEAAQGGTPTS